MRPPTNVRLATLDVLPETTIFAFLDPPPSRETLRGWFDRARIPRFKAGGSGNDTDTTSRAAGTFADGGDHGHV
jgi:hypothetical protein